VSSYGHLYLSDGREVDSYRAGVDGRIVTLFTLRDWVDFGGTEAQKLVVKTYPDVTPGEARVRGFRTQARVLRDRLDVMGVDVEGVASEFGHIRNEQISRHSPLGDWRLPEDFQKAENDLVEALHDLDWSSWCERMRRGLDAGQPLREITPPGSRDVHAVSWLLAMWDDSESRFALRALLEVLPDEETLTLDINDLIEAGWVEEDIDPQRVATEYVTHANQMGLPPIVLVEGTSDADILSRSLALRRSHLAHFVRFPEFSRGAEGSAAALRRTVTAFVAAGIPNRVLALFDADTAARDVVRSMKEKDPRIPSNIVVTHLPELELAKNYPTVGPRGERAMDVNGLGASLELYLGRDVLAHGDGLWPVRWTGFVEGVNAYQGVVDGKNAIQDAFLAKLALAQKDPGQMAAQDWTGIDLVLDHIISSVRTLR